MGCSGCGGGRVKSGAKVPVSGNLILIEYIGERARPFRVVGGVTRTRYYVDIPHVMVRVENGPLGVLAADVGWFLSVARGASYRLYVAPPPEPEPEPEEE